MLSGVKCKKTQCPSLLKVTIQLPPKRKVQKYCGTHNVHIQLSFHHNHPIESAHVLGYRPVAESTKDTYTELFSCGHSASSAHHQYEEKVLKESGQSSMADTVQLILEFIGITGFIGSGEVKRLEQRMGRIFFNSLSKRS